MAVRQGERLAAARTSSRPAPGPGRDRLPLRGPIAAGLPPERLAMLRARLPRAEVIPFAREGGIGTAPAVLLLDPAYVDETSPGWIERVATDAPVILWTEYTPRGMRAVAQSARLRPVRLLIDGLEDVPGALECALAAVPRLAHVRRLVEALSAPLEQAPASLRTACLQAIERPESMFDAEDMARAAHVSRRHLDRSLKRLGFAPAKALVVGARVWMAHLRVRGEERSVSDTAELLGYVDSKALVRHIRAVTGIGGQGFRQLDADACLARVTEFMRG